VKPVILAPQAVAELYEVTIYLASESVDVAERVLKSLQDRCERLNDAPKQGRARPDLIPGARALPFLRYLIIYSVRKDQVRVLRIIHTSRDLEAIFGS